MAFKQKFLILIVRKYIQEPIPEILFSMCSNNLGFEEFVEHKITPHPSNPPSLYTLGPPYHPPHLSRPGELNISLLGKTNKTTRFEG